ncbi:hypothetical protein L1887_08947 [Cichorium endivia]|nr:hypothetical protein L1887_08947 [Cichorium endivia]
MNIEDDYDVYIKSKTPFSMTPPMTSSERKKHTHRRIFPVNTIIAVLYYSESTQLVDKRFRESLLVYGCCVAVEFLFV